MYHPLLSLKKQKERKKKLIARFVLFFLCVVSLASLIVWAFTVQDFQIKKIVVSGNKVLLSEEIKSIAQKDIVGKYFFLFPRANVLLYPKEKIQNDIFSVFHRTNSVEISLENDNTLRISLTERDSAALWCGVEKNADAVNGCFYMDKTGYLFDTSPTFSGDAYFKFYGKGLLKEGNLIGYNFISADLFQKVFELRSMFEKYDKKIAGIFLGDDSRAELLTETGCIIIFGTDQPFVPLKSNMEAVFKSSEWGKKISGQDKCASLDYIDFRFGNKIYYRQKGFKPVIILPKTEQKEWPTGTSTPIEIPVQGLIPST